MSMRLTVVSNDAPLEKLLSFVSDLTPEHEEKIFIMEKAIKWIRALDRHTYESTQSLGKVSASLSLGGDVPQSAQEPVCTYPQSGQLRMTDHSTEKLP
jgi:hypothetical protein